MLGSHVVPMFYLEKFAVKKSKSAKTGHLWVYSMDRPPRRGTAKSEGVENGYFAFPLSSGRVDESFENSVAALEDRAKDVLLMAPNECFVWTLQYRKIMADYAGLMFARSRGRLEGSKWVHGKVSKLMRRLQEDGFLGEIATDYSRKHSQPIGAQQIKAIVNELANSNTSHDAVKGGFLEDLILNATLVTDQIVHRAWQVWCATDSSEFLTSDTPVVTAKPKNGELAPGFGFNVPGVLVFFPMNPRTCLVIGKRAVEYQHVTAERTNKVNDLIAGFMRKHVYSRTKSGVIERSFEQYGGQVQIGTNAFIPRGDHLAAFERIIREHLGLEST